MATATVLFLTAGAELKGDPVRPLGAHGVVLFEEPGALETVAEEAGTWFATHLRRSSPTGTRPAGCSPPIWPGV